MNQRGHGAISYVHSKDVNQISDTSSAYKKIHRQAAKLINKENKCRQLNLESRKFLLK